MCLLLPDRLLPGFLYTVLHAHDQMQLIEKTMKKSPNLRQFVEQDPKMWEIAFT